MIHKQFLSRDGNATILPPLHCHRQKGIARVSVALVHWARCPKSDIDAYIYLSSVGYISAAPESQGRRFDFYMPGTFIVAFFSATSG